VVGSIDAGIKAAAWSPDDEQLLLITGSLQTREGISDVRRGQSRMHDPLV
jgi:elongator complex protein 1